MERLRGSNTGAPGAGNSNSNRANQNISYIQTVLEGFEVSIRSGTDRWRGGEGRERGSIIESPVSVVSVCGTGSVCVIAEQARGIESKPSRIIRRAVHRGEC